MVMSICLEQDGPKFQKQVKKLLILIESSGLIWVLGLIPHGGPIELFLGPASAPKLVFVESSMKKVTLPLFVSMH